MSEHDRSCVFSREPQLYDVRYPPGKHFTVKGVLTFIHLGPSRRDDEPLDALSKAGRKTASAATRARARGEGAHSR